MTNENKGQIWIIDSGVDLDERMLKGLEPLHVYTRGHLPSRLQKLIPQAVDINQYLDQGTLDDLVKQVAKEIELGRNVIYHTFLPADVDALALLLRQIEDARVHILRGQNCSIELPKEALSLLGEGMASLDGFSLKGRYYPPFSPSQPALVYSPRNAGTEEELHAMLLQVYPDDHSVQLMQSASDPTSWKIGTIGMTGLRNHDILLILPRSADASLESFAGVIAQLRAPNGCPWDRKQTHESLRTYLLEETYEALATIDSGNMSGLKEELGDLLLQILLHAQIAEEKGEFTLSAMLEGINRKIVYRHPHVFGEVKVRDDRDVVQNWEKLKEKERAENGNKEEFGILNGVPIAFPALAQAQAIQDRAARVGFDWDEIDPVKAKVMEEYGEVESAEDASHRAKELGDLLFAVVNLVRWYKVDAESALRETNIKFRNRFAYIEKKARESGRELSEMTLAEMDVFWEEAKHLDA